MLEHGYQQQEEVENIFKKNHFPVSEKLHEQGLYLPSGLTLTEDEIIIKEII